MNKDELVVVTPARIRYVGRVAGGLWAITWAPLDRPDCWRNSFTSDGALAATVETPGGQLVVLDVTSDGFGFEIILRRARLVDRRARMPHR